MVTTPVGRKGSLTIIALESQLNVGKRVTFSITITVGRTHDRDDQTNYHFPQPARRLSPQSNSKRKNNDYTREGTCLALRPWQDELAIATLKHITLSTGSKARSTDDDNHTKNHDSTTNNTKTMMTRSSTFPWHKIERDR
jgi:hypothetical protein